MKSHNRILAPVLAGFALATSANAAVIVSENFVGSGSLDESSAETFSPAITSAGGSATWVAHASFNADGSITDRRKSAHLNLGTYINDFKGEANGIFVLQVTIAQPAGGAVTLASIGFAAQNSPDTSKAFNNSTSGGSTGDTNGLGTIGYRVNGAINAWGIGSANIINGPTGNTESRTFEITLDLSDHDDMSNFGIAQFAADTGPGGTFEDFGSYAYNADTDFNSILISVLGGGNGTAGGDVTTTYSNLTLTQIPEPTTALLGGLGMLVLLRRRR